MTDGGCPPSAVLLYHMIGPDDILTDFTYFYVSKKTVKARTGTRIINNTLPLVKPENSNLIRYILARL